MNKKNEKMVLVPLSLLKLLIIEPSDLNKVDLYKTVRELAVAAGKVFIEVKK
jgi:hypothetical protein